MDGVEPETVELTQRTTLARDGVFLVSGVRARWIGHELDADLLIEVNEDLTVAEGHALGEEVKHDLSHAAGLTLETVTVQIDPSGLTDHHSVTRHHLGQATARTES